MSDATKLVEIIHKTSIFYFEFLHHKDYTHT